MITMANILDTCEYLFFQKVILYVPVYIICIFSLTNMSWRVFNGTLCFYWFVNSFFTANTFKMLFSVPVNHPMCTASKSARSTLLFGSISSLWSPKGCLSHSKWAKKPSQGLFISMKGWPEDCPQLIPSSHSVLLLLTLLRVIWKYVMQIEVVLYKPAVSPGIRWEHRKMAFKRIK